MDTNRTTANFRSIEDHVVSAGDRGTRVIFKFVQRALGCRKGMVQRKPPIIFFIPLKHRKINNPQRRPLTLSKTAVMPDLESQSPHGFIDDFRFISPEEHQITGLRTHAIQNFEDGRFR